MELMAERAGAARSRKACTSSDWSTSASWRLSARSSSPSLSSGARCANIAGSAASRSWVTLPSSSTMTACDVWRNPDLFFLDDKLQPTVVAGVPPDAFSETGQLLGQSALPLGRVPGARITIGGSSA